MYKHILEKLTIAALAGLIAAAMIDIGRTSRECKWAEVSKGCRCDSFMLWLAAEAPHDDVYTIPESPHLRARYIEVTSSSNDPLLHRAASKFDEMQNVATPFLYSAISIFASEDFNTFDFYFLAVCASVCAAAIYTLSRFAGLNVLLGMVVTLAAVVSFVPITADFIVGNVNCLQLGGFALFLALRRAKRPLIKDFFAAGILAVVILIKPNTAAVALFFLLRMLREHSLVSFRRFSLGLAGGAAVCGISSIAVFGNAKIWLAWLTTIQTRVASYFPAVEADGDLALFSLLEQLIPGWPQAANLGIALAILALIGAAVWIMPRKLPEADGFHADYLITALGMLTAPLISKPTWPGYLVLTIPLYMIILASHGNQSKQVQASRAVAGISLVLTSGLTFPLLSAGELDSRAIYLGMAGIYVSGLLLLLAAGIMLAVRSPGGTR